MTKSKKRKNKIPVKRKKRSNNISFSQRYIIGGLCGIVFVAFFPIVYGDFVNYDDNLYVAENPYLTEFSLSNIWHIFSNFYHYQYSPVAMTIFAVEDLLFGENVWAFKLVSILWHVANTILVFYTIRLLFKNEFLAIVTALLFGINTMQVESVAWMAASFKTGPFVLFSLLSIVLYIKYVRGKPSKYLYLSLLLFILACLSKEQAVTLSIAVWAVDYALGRQMFSKKVLIEKIPYLIISVVFGIITLISHSNMGEKGSIIFQFDLFERIVFTMYSLGAYIGNLVVPLDLSNYHTYPSKGAIPGYYYLFLSLPFLLIALFYLSLKKYKLIAFGIMFFIFNISLTLVTQIQAVRPTMYGDRYIYLASVGFFLIIAVALDIARKKKWLSKSQLWILIGIYSVFLIVLTFNRNLKVYKDNETFWTAIIEKEEYKNGKINPYLGVPYLGRGLWRKEIGDVDGALSDYTETIRHNSKSHPTAYTNLAKIYFDKQDFTRAKINYDKAIALAPKAVEAYSGRGAIYIMEGNVEKGMAYLNKAIELKDDFKDAYKNRAIGYFRIGNFELSLKDFQKYLEFDPENYNILNSVALCYAGLNQHEKAIQTYNRCVASNPNQPAFYENRARSYRALGRMNLAIADEAKAAQLKNR